MGDNIKQNTNFYGDQIISIFTIYSLKNNSKTLYQSAVGIP